MTRKYNPKTVQKPLSQIVAERKDFYESKMAKAFDSVYSSGNFQYIEKFEGVVLGLSQRATQGSLEGIVIKPLEQPSVQVQTETIDFEQYKKSRQSGMTHKEIAEKYPNADRHQLGAYSANLVRWKKVQDAADARPVLNAEKYAALRDSGLTNIEILKTHKQAYRKQVNVLCMNYSRIKKAPVQTAASPQIQ